MRQNEPLSLFKSEKRKWREIARVGREGKDGEGDIVKPMRGSLALSEDKMGRGSGGGRKWVVRKNN